MTEDQVNDELMASDNPANWSGTSMPLYLAQRLDPASPHLPLNLTQFTVWSPAAPHC